MQFNLRSQQNADTVFLVGAGINDPLWDAVYSALQEFDPGAGIDTPDRANYYLAYWVYRRRLQGFFEKNRGPPKNSAGLRTIDEFDLLLKQYIARNLRDACERGQLRLRDRFREVVGWPDWGFCSFVTTNWDRLLQIQLEMPDEMIVHIHGDVGRPNHLYLPTETWFELYRDPAVNEELEVSANTATHLIRHARQLCIYGLSLSPLDAELIAVLQEGLANHTRDTLQIHLFNLNKELPEIDYRVQIVCPPEVQIYRRPVD